MELRASILEPKVPVNLSIKGVPDAVAEGLRARAAGNHRSLQRELMSIVEVAAMTPEAFDANRESGGFAVPKRQGGKRMRSVEEVLEDFRRIFPHPTRGPSSVDIIRAMRDTRYGDPGPNHPATRRRAR